MVVLILVGCYTTHFFADVRSMLSFQGQEMSYNDLYWTKLRYAFQFITVSVLHFANKRNKKKNRLSCSSVLINSPFWLEFPMVSDKKEHLFPSLPTPFF